MGMATEAGTSSVAVEAVGESGACRGRAPPPARISPMSDDWRGADRPTFYGEKVGPGFRIDFCSFSFFLSFLVSARASSDGIRYRPLAGPFIRPSLRKKIHTRGSTSLKTQPL